MTALISARVVAGMGAFLVKYGRVIVKRKIIWYNKTDFEETMVLPGCCMSGWILIRRKVGIPNDTGNHCSGFKVQG